MKKAVILFVALLLFVLFVPVALSTAQGQGESKKITVVGKELSNGVILAVQEDKRHEESSRYS